MLDAAILSEPTPTPDLDRAAIRRAVPAGIAQVLYVLRFLIDYACHVAAFAEECAMQGDIRPVAVPFGKGITIEALIIRVASGLKRALALREMLQQRAETGCDIEPVQRGASGPSGRSRPDGEDRDKPPETERLPSAAEIAAELERKPIGAVVADICHDIGIVPSDLTREQWDALQAVISTYGGSQAKLWPAMQHTIEAQMEAVMLDPVHAPEPHLPLIPRGSPADRRGVSQATGPPGA
jgi:hypothetical protein